jgi:hypothetical protein
MANKSLPPAWGIPGFPAGFRSKHEQKRHESLLAESLPLNRQESIAQESIDQESIARVSRWSRMLASIDAVNRRN